MEVDTITEQKLENGNLGVKIHSENGIVSTQPFDGIKSRPKRKRPAKKVIKGRKLYKFSKI